MKERVNEILVENGLDFEIVKVPLTGSFDGRSIESDYFGLYNTKADKIIHSVKGSYTVSQNSEIVEMVLKGAEPFGELSVQKAGSLHEGRKVFIQLAIDGFSKVGSDSIKRFITVIDSNDGSTGLSVGVSNLTMSCSNQFHKFYKEGTMRAMHKASIGEKIKELPLLIGEALKKDFRLMEIFREFKSTEITRNLANELVNNILGYDRTSPDSVLNDLKTRSMNMMDAMYRNIEIEMNGKGTNLWGLFSGVTRWTTHEKSAPRRENGRLESGMIGTNYKTNQKALEFCLEKI